jgi:hypothetical protein
MRVQSCIAGGHGHIDAVFAMLFADGRYPQRKLLAKQATT